MSAYIALKEFSDKIKSRGADTSLVVRMICEVPYSTEGIPEEDIMKQGFKNAMIELIYRAHKDKFGSSERPFFFSYVPKDVNKKEIIKFLREETQTKVF